MKAVVTGGGTGGHIYPAISISQALLEADPTTELLFVGSSHGPEGSIAAEAGLEFQAVPSSPLTKSVSLRNARSFGRLLAGYFRARRILKQFSPDVVVGTGGYTTAAVLMAAARMGIPTVIHEQNAVPGRTNLWLSRFVSKVCVTFENTVGRFPEGKPVVTGLPVRKEFSSLPEKREARRLLGLNEEAFTVLVAGGSLGASKVNEIVVRSLSLINDASVQVLHQVGKRNVQEAVHLLDLLYGEDIPCGYLLRDYLDMPVAMAAADLLVGRSGASTVMEATASALPGIFIPYPYAISDEQTANAKYMVERGAAVLCEQSSCSPEALAGLIKELKAAPSRLAAMAAASRALGRPDAARRVAEVALSLAGAEFAVGG